MFGTNEVTKPFPKADGGLLVSEMFYTLQGEGPDAGRPSLFIRLTKCNLRCFFCDTDFDKGEDFNVGDMTEGIRTLRIAHPFDLVVITGGEPFLQNFLPLVGRCNMLNIDVSVETAGSVLPEDVANLFRFFGPGQRNKIICSPKTPRLAPDFERFVYAYKYLLNTENSHETDGLPILSTQVPGKRMQLHRPPTGHPRERVYVQPMDEGDETKNAANLRHAAAIALRHGYRLCVQMHKLAGLP